MVTLEQIKTLREMTNSGMMDCKQALEETGGNMEKALEVLKRKGKIVAQKKGGRETGEGVCASYVHANKKLAALVELRCETDFVARAEEFGALAHDLALHVTASDPRYLSPDDIPAEDLEKERRILGEAFADSGKPPAIIAKIVEGKLNTLFAELTLLRQPFVKEPQKTVEDLLQEHVARFGENITVGRFVRFKI